MSREPGEAKNALRLLVVVFFSLGAWQLLRTFQRLFLGSVPEVIGKSATIVEAYEGADAFYAGLRALFYASLFIGAGIYALRYMREVD
jgi:hypothetical protein